MLTYCLWNPQEKSLVKLESTKLFHQLNWFENFSAKYWPFVWPQCVDEQWLWLKSINPSLSTLVQVMACCLVVPCHNLNQCWLFISDQCNFVVLWMIKLLLCMTSFKVILSEITSTYPRGQWVNCHFLFSQMTSSWFWVPSPIIWLRGRCSSRAVCSFALDGTDGGTPSIPKQPYLQWPSGYR